MSAIADRIAGRDLDREAVADELDDLLSTLVLHMEGGGLRGFAGESVEMVCRPAIVHDADMSPVRETLLVNMPPRGSVVMAQLLVDDKDESSRDLRLANGVFLSRYTVSTPRAISRALRAPRSAVPETVLDINMRSSRPLDVGRGLLMQRRWAVAKANGELWSLVNSEMVKRNYGGESAKFLRGKPMNGGSRWVCTVNANCSQGVEVPRAKINLDNAALSAFRSLTLRQFTWSVTLGYPGFVGTRMECSPEGARALFADRNVVGGKRRTALRHWVKEHYRRGHTPEESHKVREHLRGIERFGWHGLDIQLHVPSAEIEAAGLLARSGR